MRRFLRFVLAAVGVLVLAWIVLAVVRRPSLDRNWTLDQRVLPQATFEGDFVTIRNIRDFDYRSESDYTPRYYDKTFDLTKLEKVWFIVEPFAEFEGAAHTFLTYGFSNGDHVAISVEIRKEKGESFSALKGLLRNYELMYVVGDERDLIGLRTNHRKHKVYLYPARTTKEVVRTMFVDMLERANKLAKEPEFYNTLTNTCTTNVVAHVNRAVPGRVPFRREVLLPGYADSLAYELGLIDTTASREKLREQFYISDKARAAEDAPDFSARIRQ